MKYKYGWLVVDLVDDVIDKIHWRGRTIWCANKETDMATLPRLTGVERKQILNYTARKGGDAIDLRRRLAKNLSGGDNTAGLYINAYANATLDGFFVPQAKYSAYFLALATKVFSDPELANLPEPPAWLDDPSKPVPAESVDTGAWGKYLRTMGGHVKGSQDDATAEGMKRVIAAVLAGDPSPKP